MIKVSSSNLDEVDYNEADSSLLVKFKNGGTYRYAGVPKTAYEELIKAKSVGSYFMSNIRNAYEATKE